MQFRIPGEPFRPADGFIHDGDLERRGTVSIVHDAVFPQIREGPGDKIVVIGQGRRDDVQADAVVFIAQVERPKRPCRFGAEFIQRIIHIFHAGCQRSH